MKRKYVYILVPLLTAVFLLVNAWISIFTKNYIPQISHYLAVIFILPPFIFLLNRFNWSVLYTGVYLLLTTFNVFSLSADLSSNQFCFGASPNQVCTPGVNLPSLGVLVLFLIFNYTLLEGMYIDYSERKSQKPNS